MRELIIRRRKCIANALLWLDVAEDAEASRTRAFVLAMFLARHFARLKEREKLKS